MVTIRRDQMWHFLDRLINLTTPRIKDFRGLNRKAFDRQKDIEYSIKSISGKDLEITKESDRVVIAFAYDVEVPIMGPVFLLVKYEGRSK